MSPSLAAAHKSFQPAKSAAGGSSDHVGGKPAGVGAAVFLLRLFAGQRGGGEASGNSQGCRPGRAVGHSGTTPSGVHLGQDRVSVPGQVCRTDRRLLGRHTWGV